MKNIIIDKANGEFVAEGLRPLLGFGIFNAPEESEADFVLGLRPLLGFGIFNRNLAKAIKQVKKCLRPLLGFGIFNLSSTKQTGNL